MNQQVATALNWRYATKKFDKDRKIPLDEWESLVESLRLAPSSYGLQPWKFVVVESQEIREKLKEAAWGQEQIVSADKLVILCRLKKLDEAAIDRHIENTASTRKMNVESLAGYKQMLLGLLGRSELELQSWMDKQVYISLGFLLESAALLRIDACPMEGFAKDKFDEILGLSELGLASTVVAALGYRSPEDQSAANPKVRFLKKDLMIEVK